MFILKALCVAVIIFVQPVCSHPHNKGVTKPIPKPSFEHAAVRHMHSMHAMDTTHFAHRLVTKRQASDFTLDEEDCDIQLLDISCSSGYIQFFADTILNCGERDNARLYANLCAQNEMGEYCETVYYKLHNVDPLLNYINGNCSTSLTSGSCHANCREQIELLKDKLGCCPFQYLNDSYVYSIGPAGLMFDYRLLNLCDIPLSIPPCRSPHANQQTCTFEEVTRKATQGLCQPGGVGQTFISKIVDNQRCSQIYDRFNTTALYVVWLCSLNAHGEYCDVIEENVPVYSTISNINFHCRPSNASECNQACVNTIMETKSTLGCCINRYNNSAGEPSNFSIDGYQAAVSYDLWNSCGVELPGTCGSTLSLTPSGSQSLMQGQGITIWVIVTLLVLIQR